MIYKLVLAGVDTFSKCYKHDEEEVIIAVDGGYETLRKNNIKVDYYFGDHDSLQLDDINADNITVYPTMKDYSDFDLAISFLIEDNKISITDEVYVYNATGGRLDHYFAIINTIIRLKDYHICLVDDRNKIFVGDKEMSIKKNEYKYISFFSITTNTIINLDGFIYNVSDYHLRRDNNLCLSNEIKEIGHIKSSEKLLIIMSNNM